MPISRPSIPPSNPARDYAAALARIQALQGRDHSAANHEAVNPRCHTYLLTHGQRTERVVLFFHGYTNCPAQFHHLAQHFFAAGDNVFAPRLPHHGYRDRLTPAHGKLTAPLLMAAAQEAIDIACGLGQEIVLMGLSAGAIMAAWAAHVRPEVDVAIVAAPSLGLPGWPVWASDAMTWLLQQLPNFMIWWDQKARAAIEGPPHAYPRFATRGLSEVIALGKQVRHMARTQAPLARRLVVIQTAADIAVHQGLVAQLAADWAHSVPERVQLHTFPLEQAILHDMIDPTQPRQRIDLVYPVWIKAAGIRTNPTTTPPQST